MKVVLYICFSCQSVSACSDGINFKKCSECRCYIRGRIPCRSFDKAQEVDKNYECDICREERLMEEN